MGHRVVVTGLGLVTPLANSRDESWAALLAGRSGAGPITKFDASRLHIRFACEVKQFDPLATMDRKEAKRMDLFAQFAMAATHEAMTEAGLSAGVPAPERTGVIIGSGIGGIATFEEQCRLSIEKGPDRVSPSSFRCSFRTSPPGWSPSATA